MPAIDFPASPTLNQEYSFEGRTWRWNGTGWEVKEYPAALLAGTAANPSLYFSGDTNTGLYSPGADQAAITTGGTQKFTIDSLDGNAIIENSFPTIRPSLDLAFALTKVLDPRVTFTRSSDGTYTDANGVLRTATTNIPRFDHNPTTGESLGLLVEEARTNSIRNNTMVGAVAGTPGTLPTNWSLSSGGIGTLTQQVVGIGTSNGITYIDIKYSGTSSNTGVRIFTEAAGNTSATSGQTWTASAYVTLLAGSTGITSLSNDVVERNVGNSIIQTTTGNAYTAVGASLTRLVTTRTLSDATTASTQQAITLNWPNATSVDFTLRIGLPQLEQGAFATSVIPTTTATATRSADVPSSSGSSYTSWAAASEGTLFATYATLQTQSSFFPAVASITDGSNSNRIQLAHSGGSRRAVITSGGSSQWDTTGGALGAPSSNVPANFVIAYKSADFAACANGGSFVSQSSGSVPSATRLTIGTDGTGSNHLNGHIRRLTYWPARLGNTTLQAITK